MDKLVGATTYKLSAKSLLLTTKYMLLGCHIFRISSFSRNKEPNKVKLSSCLSN
jgi:hypothetical protein